jgi:hypothetical protein
MDRDICESVDGSISEYTVRRIDVYRGWVPVAIPGLLNNVDGANLIDYRPIIAHGCYNFSCSCPIAKNRWVTNEDWTFNDYDKTKHCVHLFGVLTIYEHHRVESQRPRLMNFIQAPRDKINMKAYKIATGVFSYKKLEDQFNKSSNTNCKALKITDKSDRKNYTVKKTDQVWSCSCKSFYYRGYCKHINQVKNSEAHKQDMRELGISLAIKYFSQT